MTNNLPTIDKLNHEKMWNTRGRTGTILSNGYRHGQIHGVRNYEHRRVMELSIGRKLLRSESVHHVDGNKLNNNINNLVLISRSDHAKFHAIERGLGKDRAGISPTNKTSKNIIEKIKALRKDGLFLRQIQKITKLSWPTVQKYAK